jgi:mRNA interferase HigB
MRIISRKTLSDYWEAHRDVEDALEAWFAEAEHAAWHTPADIKQRYPSVDPVGNNRMVFNIKGNHYRLVVKIHYNVGFVYIRFIGTHAEYDKIDAEKI